MLSVTACSASPLTLNRLCVHLGWLIPSEMVTGPTCNSTLSVQHSMSPAFVILVPTLSFPHLSLRVPKPPYGCQPHESCCLFSHLTEFHHSAVCHNALHLLPPPAPQGAQAAVKLSATHDGVLTATQLLTMLHRKLQHCAVHVWHSILRITPNLTLSLLPVLLLRSLLLVTGCPSSGEAVSHT
jgi:hypothetical protein